MRIDHDAKATGLGEFHYGAGRGERSMVYVIVGTGVGAAIIADGQLYRGLHNSSGEFGHTTLDRFGAVCSCGSRGCVETFMSGPWLARRYAAAQRGETPTMDTVTSIGGQEIAALAEQGDPLALRIITEAGEALGAAIATLAMILDIECYVIGGSVAHCGELFFAPARRTVPHYSFRSVGERVRIVGNQLDTDGASWVAPGWRGRRSRKSNGIHGVSRREHGETQSESVPIVFRDSPCPSPCGSVLHLGAAEQAKMRLRR